MPYATQYLLALRATPDHSNSDSIDIKRKIASITTKRFNPCRVLSVLTSGESNNGLMQQKYCGPYVVPGPHKSNLRSQSGGSMYLSAWRSRCPGASTYTRLLSQHDSISQRVNLPLRCLHYSLRIIRGCVLLLSHIHFTSRFWSPLQRRIEGYLGNFLVATYHRYLGYLSGNCGSMILAHCPRRQ